MVIDCHLAKEIFFLFKILHVGSMWEGEERQKQKSTYMYLYVTVQNRANSDIEEHSERVVQPPHQTDTSNRYLYEHFPT